jgi:hypothetical protein
MAGGAWRLVCSLSKAARAVYNPIDSTLEDNYLHYCPHVGFRLIQISIFPSAASRCFRAFFALLS